MRRSPRLRSSLCSTSRALVAAAVTFGVAFGLPTEARAARELLVPAGEKGTLALDQISGFRASMINGLTYAGPLGFSHRQFSEHSFDSNTDSTTRLNTFWLTPSADLFVIDHLSVGLLLEYSNTWGSADVVRNDKTTQTVTLKGTTTFTILPRVGYLFSINDRFAIWPRAGLGYARIETNQGTSDVPLIDAFSGVVMEVDVGLLYRFNETFFMRASPDLVFSIGGSHSVSSGGTTTSAGAGILQASAVFGVGVFFDLY